MAVPQLPQPHAPLDALFALLPEQQANPIGNALHETWLTIVEVTLPGQPGSMAPEMPLPYAVAFFGDQSLDATGAAVRDQLGSSWWASYSETFVTQALFNIAMSARDQINYAIVTSDLADLEPALRASALGGYSIVFNANEAATISTAAGANPAAARQEYLNVLTSPAWIAAKEAALSDSQWPGAAWELFHHAIKLLALGAAQTDVTAAFQRLADGGLTMPPEVNASNWTSYRQFIPSPSLQWSDLSKFTGDDNSGFLRGNYVGGLWQSETYAQWFVDGTKYYTPPTGSCFSPWARVLLPDGGDRALCDINPGDEVWTPDGARRVRVAARALRRGRTLYRLNDSRFEFSDSHPFVDGHKNDASLAVHTPRAAVYTGGVAAYGLGPLAPGASVAVAARNGIVSPQAVEQVTESAPVPGDGEELIDLILEPSEAGFPPYAVGDGGEAPFFIVRPEVLRFERHPFGASVGLALLAGSIESSIGAMADLKPGEAPLVARAMRILADRLISEALRTLSVEAAPDPPPSITPIHRELDAFLDSFHDPTDGGFDWRRGALHEALASTLLVPFDHAVAGGWRAVDHDVAGASQCSITLHDIVSEGHFPITGDWTVALYVNDRLAGTTAVGDHQGVDHHRHICWTMTGALPCTGARLQPAVLGVRLTGPNGVTLSGQTAAPTNLQTGHRHAGLLLRACESGEIDATIRFDLRLLCNALAARHPNRPPEVWDEGARSAFAARFGPALAAHFSELFPEALAEARRHCFQ